METKREIEEQTPAENSREQKKPTLKLEIELFILTIMLLLISFIFTAWVIIPGIKLWQFILIDMLSALSFMLVRLMRKHRMKN